MAPLVPHSPLVERLPVRMPVRPPRRAVAAGRIESEIVERHPNGFARERPVAPRFQIDQRGAAGGGSRLEGDPRAVLALVACHRAAASHEAKRACGIRCRNGREAERGPSAVRLTPRLALARNRRIVDEGVELDDGAVRGRPAQEHVVDLCVEVAGQQTREVDP
jgi:hypothetical protein